MQLTEFRNEPLRDFKGNPEHKRRMKEALEEVRQKLGQEYDLVINGERIKTQDKFSSYNPGQKDQAVGVFSKADAELADRAIRAADEALKTWSHTPAEQRAELALETARIIRERKFHFGVDVLRSGQDVGGGRCGRGGGHRLRGVLRARNPPA